MSITNYTELKSSVADWLMRDDLTDRIPDFIMLGESYIKRNLRTEDMVNRSRATATGRFLALPGDWRHAVNIQRTADEQFLQYRPMQELDRLRKMETDGVTDYPDGPTFYSIVGNELELFPAATPTDTYEIEMVYYATTPALSTGNPSNWLLTEAPDLYLYAALVHSSPYLKEDDRVQVWTAMMREIVADMNAEHEMSKHSGSTLTRTWQTLEGM